MSPCSGVLKRVIYIVRSIYRAERRLGFQLEYLVLEVDSHRSEATKNVFTKQSIYSRSGPVADVVHVKHSHELIFER